jgi:hypothetical protein
MTSPVRIPADVDMPDRIIGPLTARQTAILAAAALLLYLTWEATRNFLPPAVFLGIAVPVAVSAIVVAVGRRDGVAMDRMLIAAIRHRASPRTRIARTPAAHTAAAQTAGPGRRPAPLRFPVTAVTAAQDGTGLGVLDLDGEGLAVVAVASTVNFALRTPLEQETLVATFARYLHSLSAPVQILIRAERLDLGRQITHLKTTARRAHPALRAAALDHAAFLDQLNQQTLLGRQVLLVMREPISPSGRDERLDAPPAPSMTGSPARRGSRRRDHARTGARRAAEIRLARRLSEAVGLLAPAGITITSLDAPHATAVLITSCNPDAPSNPDASGHPHAILATSPRRAGATDPTSGPPTPRRPAGPDGGVDRSGLDELDTVPVRPARRPSSRRAVRR